VRMAVVIPVGSRELYREKVLSLPTWFYLVTIRASFQTKCMRRTELGAIAGFICVQQQRQNLPRIF